MRLKVINFLFVFKLDVEMNLEIRPQDITEGRSCQAQCTALLKFPSTEGFLTWKMKDTVVTNGDRYQNRLQSNRCKIHFLVDSKQIILDRRW